MEIFFFSGQIVLELPVKTKKKNYETQKLASISVTILSDKLDGNILTFCP